MALGQIDTKQRFLLRLDHCFHTLLHFLVCMTEPDVRHQQSAALGCSARHRVALQRLDGVVDSQGMLSSICCTAVGIAHDELPCAVGLLAEDLDRVMTDLDWRS